MNCFFNFKDKSKSEKAKAKSAPELKNQSGSGNNLAGTSRSAKSSSSSLPSPRRSIREMYQEKEHCLRVFTLPELRAATSEFSRMLKIGEGGFGSVYKGSIAPPSGRGQPMVVAIKKLNKHSLQAL